MQLPPTQETQRSLEIGEMQGYSGGELVLHLKYFSIKKKQEFSIIFNLKILILRELE